MGKPNNVTKPQLERYPSYLKLLYSLLDEGVETVSSIYIASRMGNSQEQVRKDFQVIAPYMGKPGAGRDVRLMIAALEDFLGYRSVTDAILVGVGHLGDAFLRYEGFGALGLNILAGFDVDPAKIGHKIGGKPVLDVETMGNFIESLHVKLAILTVPAFTAREVAEQLCSHGIKGVWNFAPVRLDLGEDVIVENVDLASSLAVLSHKMKRNNK